MHTTDALNRLLEPLNTIEFCPFISLFHVFHRFVLSLAQTATPLDVELIGVQAKTFWWHDSWVAAYRAQYSKKMVSTTMLALLDAMGKDTLDTDECNLQIGCVLSQEQLTETVKPVEYWSWSLTNAEQTHSSTQREHFSLFDMYQCYDRTLNEQVLKFWPATTHGSRSLI